MQGYTGYTGYTGALGPTGPQGIVGATGVSGPQGIRGRPGPQGKQGCKGLRGCTGFTGYTGFTGPGFTTITGETGPVNILTANNTINSAIGNTYFTYTSNDRKLYVGQSGAVGVTGAIETHNLVLKNIQNDTTSSKFLLLDANNNVTYNTGGNYPGTVYRDTITFGFVSNSSTPGFELNSSAAPGSDNVVGVYYQPAQSTTTYVSIVLVNTAGSTGALSLFMYDLYDSSTDTTYSIANTGSSGDIIPPDTQNIITGVSAGSGTSGTFSIVIDPVGKVTYNDIPGNSNYKPISYRTNITLLPTPAAGRIIKVVLNVAGASAGVRIISLLLGCAST
jgi:collagen type VII alpha